MKKNRILNIVLTTIMLLSTILSPQISYALGENLKGVKVEVEASQVDREEEKETEGNVEGNIHDENGEDEDDAKQIEGADSEVPADDTDIQTDTDTDIVDDGTSADTNNNDPPEDRKKEDAVAVIQPFNKGIRQLQVKDLGNIFTNPRLTLREERIEDGDIIDIDSDTKVQLEYDWNTAGINASNGDMATLQLPDIFQQVTIQNRPVTTGGITVGTYSIVGGLLTLTFNEQIEVGDVSNGVLGLNLQFDMAVFEEDIEQVIAFNDKDKTTLEVTARPSNAISGITKEGHPDRDKDAREIIWTIDVMNDNDDSILEATLQDILHEGLGNPRDFFVNELSVGLNGDKRVGAKVTVEPQVDGNKFSIDFENVAPFTGYRIQYITTIEDYTIDSFTNDASLSYGETKLSTEATVDGLERSNPIQKEGEYNRETHQIDWTITVNESGGEIEEAIVYDTLTPEQSLVEKSIEVFKFDSNWGNKENLTADLEEFPITLGPVAANEIYQIKFSTEIDWNLVNGGVYQHYNQFTNETKLRDGEILVGEDEATVDHLRASLLEKSGVSNVNYDNNTLTWTVLVNNAKHPLSDAVINDVIPEGLSISEDDISITSEDGGAYTGANLSVNGQNVEIDLGNIGTKTIIIEYTTTITDFKKNEFDNIATLEGNGIGVGEPEAVDNETISPPANSFAKSFEGIDYNKRTMNWSLTVNPIREALKELTIVDTFPNQGLIMLPDTLEITVGGEKVTEGFKLTPNEEDNETGYHKGFTIVIDNNLLPLNAQMEINYQTSYDPQFKVEESTLDPHVGGENQERVYLNRAQFKGITEHNNEFDTIKDASTTVIREAWNSGKKEGQLVHEGEKDNLINGWVRGSGRKIAWQLYTNYQQQDLGTGVVIEDTLGYEGTIDKDSVAVKKYTVNEDGNTNITDEILDPNYYKVDYNGKTFILTFNDDFKMDERYVVEFTTTVPNISQPNYTNNATVKVGGKEYPYEGTVNYDKHDAFLKKGAVGLEGNQVYTGDEIEWEVTVNESLSFIQNATITDVISPGLVYVENSLEITTANGRKLNPTEDYTLTVSSNDESETILFIKLEATLTETLVLSYNTVVTEIDGQVYNTINLDGEDINVEPKSSQQLYAREFSWVGGEFNPNRGAIRVTKVDSEEEKIIKNNEATFILEFELNGERVRFGDEFTTRNGVLEIGNLPIRTYYLKEVVAPKGYVKSEKEIEINVEHPFTNNNVYEIEFENTKEKTEITGTKIWEGGEAQRPEFIKLHLFRDGTSYGKPVILEAGETKYTWENLDVTDIDGNAYKYTVAEVEVPENFVQSASDDGLTITNKFVSPLIDISVEKRWDDADNQDGIRPDSIEVALLPNNEEKDVENITLSEENNWQGVFTDLPEFDDAGEVIGYSVVEIDAEPRYESRITGDVKDGFVITNSYEPELINITGEKIWNDADNQDGIRPEAITVNLLANGKEIDEKVITANDNWSYTFSNLPKFEAGAAITYTVTEDAVEGYTTEINGYDITNSYTPEERSVTVTKLWQDGNNQDGKRSDSVEVQLFANNEPYGDPITLSDETDWTYTWTGLAVNEPVGEKIEYTVQEMDVHRDYTVDINDEDLGNIIITNNYVPELIDIAGEKIWNDADNQDGIRPEAITVNLLANGKKIDSQVVTADDDWIYSFENLARYENQGEEIEYTVEEESVENYEASYDGYDITNNYTPEVIDISGKKYWNDVNNQDGKRPESITVHLLADGVKVNSVEVTEADDWAFEFNDIPKYKNGKEITYTIQEDGVEGYSTKIDGYEITNSYTPGKINVNVVKSWNDLNNVEARPEAITVNLLADGEQIASVELTDENNWQADFVELDKYANGELIEYTVEEATPHGYVNEDIEGNASDGFIITNRPAKVSIGDYVWLDKNKDGLQDEDEPGISGVVLAVRDADGNEVTDVYGYLVGPTTTDKNGWYTFDNLPPENTYTVYIDREKSAEALEGLVPTLEEAGGDRANDSSTWIAISRYLKEDGERDPTLDFGFIRVEDSNTPTEPEKPKDPNGETPTAPDSVDSEKSDDKDDLPKAGETGTYIGLAITLLVIGLSLAYYERRLTN